MKYKGVRPATLVSIIEGNGNTIPLERVDYVVVFKEECGISRQVTLGKVVELTKEERASFDSKKLI